MIRGRVYLRLGGDMLSLPNSPQREGKRIMTNLFLNLAAASELVTMAGRSVAANWRVARATVEQRNEVAQLARREARMQRLYKQYQPEIEQTQRELHQVLVQFGVFPV